MLKPLKKNPGRGGTYERPGSNHVIWGLLWENHMGRGQTHTHTTNIGTTRSNRWIRWIYIYIYLYPKESALQCKEFQGKSLLFRHLQCIVWYMTVYCMWFVPGVFYCLHIIRQSSGVIRPPWQIDRCCIDLGCKVNYQSFWEILDWFNLSISKPNWICLSKNYFFLQ